MRDEQAQEERTASLRSGLSLPWRFEMLVLNVSGMSGLSRVPPMSAVCECVCVRVCELVGVGGAQ